MEDYHSERGRRNRVPDVCKEISLFLLLRLLLHVSNLNNNLNIKSRLSSHEVQKTLTDSIPGRSGYIIKPRVACIYRKGDGVVMVYRIMRHTHTRTGWSIIHKQERKSFPRVTGNETTNVSQRPNRDCNGD